MSDAVLVSGAGGFLGAALVGELLAAGRQVVALTRGDGVPARLRAHAGRITVARWDPVAPRVAGDFAALIHAAACYGRAGEPLAALVEANVLAGLRLVEALSGRCGACLAIGTSLPAAVSAYARSKHQFAAWGPALGARMPFVHLRCEHFYGPGDDAGKFVTRVARACLANVPRLELTAGTQRRDFIAVGDAARAVVAVLERGVPERGCAELDVGSGDARPVRAVVEHLHRAADSRTELAFGAVPLRPDEPAESVADVRPLARLGWSARLTLEQGLDHLIAEERACAS